MNILKTLPCTAAASLCMLAASMSPVQAALISTANAVSCDSANVYVNYAGHGTATFDRCIGPLAGNLTSNPTNITGIESQIATSLSLDVSYVGLSNGTANGPFTSDPGTASGLLVLDSLIQGAFVLGLHGPNPGNSAGQYSLYAFDNPNSWDVVSVYFEMSGTSVKNGNAQNLSHAALYAVDTPLLTPNSTLAVPEPQSLALLLVALGAAGWAWRDGRSVAAQRPSAASR